MRWESHNADTAREFLKDGRRYGGLAKVNVAFANEMARRGHTVTTVYADDREGAPFLYKENHAIVAWLERA